MSANKEIRTKCPNGCPKGKTGSITNAIKVANASLLSTEVMCTECKHIFETKTNGQKVVSSTAKGAFWSGMLATALIVIDELFGDKK